MDEHNCGRCGGFGYQVWDEDDRRVKDVCYHCAGTGKVDSETAFHDAVEEVAYFLAYEREKEYRRNVNEDPDGEGYDFAAAENMMYPEDYFLARVDMRRIDYSQELWKLDVEQLKVLIAWRHYR